MDELIKALETPKNPNVPDLQVGDTVTVFVRIKEGDNEINIEPYTLHDLRRTFSSIMAKLGTPIHVTEKLLNHASGRAAVRAW